MAVEPIYRLGYGGDVVFREVLMNGQRQHGLSLTLGGRKIPFLVTELASGRLQVDGYRVVDSGFDATCQKRLPKRVTSRGDNHESVEHVELMVSALGNPHLIGRYALPIDRGVVPPFPGDVV